jgi:peptidyl-prolyl cis-trans isomerase A (cyclophilin A)
MKRGYSIFGQVIEGYDIVEAISQVSTDGSDRPTQPVVINKLEIIRD